VSRLRADNSRLRRQLAGQRRRLDRIEAEIGQLRTMVTAGR
jgi:hypothetical protein